MSDINAASGSGQENTLDAILSRLERIESFLILAQGERLEGGEPIEDEENAEFAASSDAGGASAAPQMLSPAAQFERFLDGQGFAHFHGSEFTPYWSRERNGVRNSIPPRDLWNNIVPTLAVLERFRREIGVPVNLLSTFRSIAYNVAVGGAGDSQHSHFRAIDFTCSRGGPEAWARTLKGYRGDTFRNSQTGQNFVFHGGVGIYVRSNFVHVDTRGNDANWTG